jgi:hypothetical protein
MDGRPREFNMAGPRRFRPLICAANTVRWAMSGEYTFKNVWLKNDEQAERDAIAAWTTAKVLPRGLDPMTRAKELLIAAYDGNELAAVTTCAITHMPMLRANFAVFRLFIVPGQRRQGIAGPMTHETFEAMREYALANPALRIAGLAAYVTTPEHLRKPYTPHERLMLIGYSDKGTPIIAKWFDHFELG